LAFLNFVSIIKSATIYAGRPIQASAVAEPQYNGYRRPSTDAAASRSDIHHMRSVDASAAGCGSRIGTRQGSQGLCHRRAETRSQASAARRLRKRWSGRERSKRGDVGVGAGGTPLGGPPPVLPAGSLRANGGCRWLSQDDHVAASCSGVGSLGGRGRLQITGRPRAAGETGGSCKADSGRHSQRNLVGCTKKLRQTVRGL
jgi:hypothetical protein